MAAVLWLLVLQPVMSRVQRIGSSGACMAGLAGFEFVGSPGDETCTLVTNLDVYDVTADQGHAYGACARPVWALGPRVGVGILYSREHALAVASAIKNGSQALVALVDSGSSGAWAWQWTGTDFAPPGSSYGEGDPSAWVDGIVPPADPALCVVLNSAGLLKAVSCTHANLPFITCSVTTCCQPGIRPCPTLMGASPYGLGCPAPNARSAVESYHIFRGWERSLAEGETTFDPASAYVGVGCGNESWADTNPRAMVPMPLYFGDDLRVCGDLPVSQNIQAATFRPAWSLNRKACPDAISAGGNRCGEFDLGLGFVSDVPDVAVPPVVVLASNFVCAHLKQHAGIVRCWQGSSLVDPVLFDTSTRSALSAHSGSPYACSVDPSRNVACFGTGPAAQGWTGANAWMVAAGREHACFLDWFGVVFCWGANDRGQTALPPGLPMMSRLAAGTDHTCAVATNTGALYCWGSGSSMLPADLPPLEHVFCGPNITCGSPVGGGLLRCWQVGGTAQAVTVPPDVAGVYTVEFGARAMCAVLAQTGRVRCWGEPAAGEVPPPPDLPAVTALALDVRGTGGCAVLTANGSISCWGDRGSGEVGITVMRGGDPTLLGLSTNVGSSHFAPGGIDTRPAIAVRSLLWAPGDITIMRHVVGSLPESVPGAHFTFRLMSARMSVRLWLQDAPTLPARVEECALVRQFLAYEQRCEADSVFQAYGTAAIFWNGTAWDVYSVPRPTERALLGGQVYSEGRAGFASPPFDTLPVAQSIAAAYSLNETSLPLVLGVRPGDVVTVEGAGFGLHAVLSATVPWWSPSAALGQTLRSCIHLAWWASPASYHNDSACVCNGREDWLGEGEVPHSAVQEWDNDALSFVVPPGEGVREVRLCVEGRGVNVARSASSVYLVYEPSALLGMLPATYVESTDVDTPAALLLGVTAPERLGPLQETAWGACNVDLLALPSQPGSGRIPLLQPLPSDDSFSALRFCTASVSVTADNGDCFVMQGWQNMSRALLAAVNASAQISAMLNASRSCAPVLYPAPLLEQDVGVRHPAFTSATFQVASSTTQVLTVSLPSPLPNALLNRSYTVTSWDAGMPMRWGPELATVTFRRSPPILSTITPNPLLLGPVGGANEASTGQFAVLTMFGLGMRTREEVLDPRNGLLGRSPDVQVWIDDVWPCSNASVIRTASSFAYLTCIYPADVVGGGEHAVTVRMIDVNTSVRPSQSGSLPLSTACSPGYFGLGGPGAQRCLSCPVGGSCAGGTGNVVKAQAGFYNLGEQDSNACPTAVLSRTGGRASGCVIPCEPPEACEADNMCASGYVSVPPTYRCATCASGFYRTSGVCIECPVLGLGAVLILVTVVLLAASILCVLSSNMIRLSTLTTVLDYLQLVSLLQMPTLPWPEAVRSALRAMSIARLQVDSLAPECYTPLVTPESKLWSIAIMPLVVVTLAAVLYLALGLFKQMLSGTAQAWSHGAATCRLLLKLLNALYLPVISACLLAFNCIPLQPDSDGLLYLLIAPGEQCGVPGGLQERMKGWAIAGLVCFGALYPLCLFAFYWLNHDVIVEAQILRAAGVGVDKLSNPRAFRLQSLFAPLFEDFRPGLHYAALLSLSRKALVCVCALMLNKSPLLLSAAIVLTLVVALTCQALLQPVMTPVYGYSAALAHFCARLELSSSEADKRVLRYITEAADKSGSPLLAELAQGRALCTDVANVSKPLLAGAVDWNILECQLQLQVVVVGLLSIMYGASLDSVYREGAETAVTVTFFSILFVAVGHICATVGYDFLLQLNLAMRSLLHEQSAAATTSHSAHSYHAHALGLPPNSNGWGGLEGLLEQGLTTRAVLYLFLFRCCMTRERARAIALGAGAVALEQDEDGPQRGAGMPASPSAGMCRSRRWLASILHVEEGAKAEDGKAAGGRKRGEATESTHLLASARRLQPANFRLPLAVAGGELRPEPLSLAVQGVPDSTEDALESYHGQDGESDPLCAAGSGDSSGELGAKLPG